MGRDKKPSGPSWHQEFVFLLLLERCGNPISTYAERYFAIMRAVKNASALGYKAGFREAGNTKIAYIVLPTGDEVSWTVEIGSDSLEPSPDQKIAIANYSKLIHSKEKK